MADEATVVATPDTTSSANITTEVTTYRTYGKYSVNDKGESVLDKVSVLGETRDKKNWEAAEANQLTQLAESSIRFYSVANETGFSDLVPDSDQRVYLINKGIAAVQAAAAAAAMKDQDKDGNFVNNGITVDLRDAINEPPQRKVQNPEEKALKAFGALDAASKARILEALKMQLAGLSGE